MKLYLAGPMRGIEDYNYPLFFKVANDLRKQGYDVFNPAELDGDSSEEHSLEYYMQRDLPHVIASDAIAVLPGWAMSDGATREVRVARDCGKKVYCAMTMDEIPDFVNLSRKADETAFIKLVLDSSSGDYDLERDWAMIVKEIFEVFKAKQHDYGPNNIALLRDQGVLTRVTDKFMRLHTLYKSGAEPSNESLEDTWLDIADYAVIALMCIRGYWPTITLEEATASD